METLSRLWMQGRTASQIAELLGPGITRNAVIGKVHRLGLCSGENVGLRAATIKAGALAAASEVEGAPAPVAEEAPAKALQLVRNDPPTAQSKKRPVPSPASVTIVELTDEMCRWPIDDPDVSGFRYCGAPATGAAPYCARHSKLAYQPTRSVRRPPDRHALFPGISASTQKA